MKKALITSCVFVSFLMIFFIYNLFSARICLKTEKEYYFHNVLVPVYVQDKHEKLKDKDFRVLVFRNGVPVVTIGDKRDIKLKYITQRHQWEGAWPIPWNAPVGEYELKLWVSPEEFKKINTRETNFKIARRKPQEIPEALCILTWENMKFFHTMQLTGPDGEKGDWRKIFDWAEWMGADTFWFIAGQTSAYIKKIPSEFPWNTDNIEMLDDVVKESHKRGIKCGAWISCYYTFGPRKYQPDYKYGWDYKRSIKTSVLTDAISILDEKRLTDIIEFAKKLEAINELSYIGFDYIPDDYGGMELVNTFVSEMEVDLPERWESKSFKERMDWLGNIVKRVENRDIALIDQWNWWRAHRISTIIKRIKEGANITKPLWAFILSWEKGWQHGQDPIMFQDAGVDINAVMLYQANRKQFNELIKDWHDYVKEDEVNVVCGNQIDWYWHQNMLDPPGPEEYYRRLITGMENIYNDGLAKGIFVHDLSRAFWGRKGPYLSKEWLIAGASAFSRLREHRKWLPIKTTIQLQKSVFLGSFFYCTILVENISNKNLKNLEIELLLPANGIICLEETKKQIGYLSVGEKKEISFRLQAVKLDEKRDSRWMIASRVTRLKKPNFSFGYVKVFEDIIVKKDMGKYRHFSGFKNSLHLKTGKLFINIPTFREKILETSE